MLVKIAFISGVGALIVLDEYTVFQTMISRPIACGPLIGYLLGDVKTGIVFGIILELILLNTLPMGVSIPVETSLLAVISTSLGVFIPAFSRSSLSPALITWILIWVIPMGGIFKQAQVLHKNVNVNLMHRAEEKINAGKPESLGRYVYTGMALAFVRAFILVMLSIFAGVYLLPLSFGILPAKAVKGLETAYGLLPVLGMAVAVNTFSFTSLCERYRDWKTKSER